MPSKILTARETLIVWKDSGGDLVMTLNGLVAGAARIGAQKDFGSGSTSDLYEWRLTVQFETTPTVGETVEVYLSTSDGTKEDGQEGEADADLVNLDSLKNMHFIGSLVVTSTASAHAMTASGVCRIPTRYVSPVINNNTGDDLKASANVSAFTLTPIPLELQ